jgi:hypothetical protein
MGGVGQNGRAFFYCDDSGGLQSHARVTGRFDLGG